MQTVRKCKKQEIGNRNPEKPFHKNKIYPYPYINLLYFYDIARRLLKYFEFFMLFNCPIRLILRFDDLKYSAGCSKIK